MKSRNRKQTPVLAVAAAVLGLVSACSNGGGQQSGQSGQNTGSDPSAPAKKQVITVSAYDRGQVPPEEGTMEKNRWTQWINQHSPVEVKWIAIPRNESVEKLNALFAAGDAPDLVFEYSAQFRNDLYALKQIMPLDDLIEKHSIEYKKLLQQYPALKKLGTKPDGKLYEIGRAPGLQTNHVLFIRNDWLKKLNLSVPKTTDDLYKAAKAFVENDPDGNGKKDTIGMNISFVGEYTLDQMFQNQHWFVNKNGAVEHAWEQAREATAFRKALFEEGIVDKDFLTDKNGQKAKQDWINGKLGIYAANVGLQDFATFEAFMKNNPNAEAVPIPLPASRFGSFSPILGVPYQMTAVVNAKAKNPEAVMKFIDFLVSEPTAKMLNLGEEGVHYKLQANGCPQPVDPAKNRKELDYFAVNQIISPVLFGGKCNHDLKYAQYDPAKPMEAAFLNVIKQAREAYLSPDRPMSGITHIEWWPALPNDLVTVRANSIQQVSDTLIKAVVSSGYTVDQAVQDAKTAWEKGGGTKVDDWLKTWYAENKGKAMLTEDMYK